jgi:hypothetical protein
MRPATATFGIGLLALTLFTMPAPAQLPGLGLGAGVRYASPSGDFGDAVDPGYGGYVKVEIGALMLGAAAEANLTRFGGEGNGESATVLGIQAGPRLGMGLFKVGLDLGWYSEVEKTGYTPNVSLGLGPLEAGAGATFFSGGRWFFLRAGLRF